jgi:hypothetical protein
MYEVYKYEKQNLILLKNAQVVKSENILGNDKHRVQCWFPLR